VEWWHKHIVTPLNKRGYTSNEEGNNQYAFNTAKFLNRKAATSPNTIQTTPSNQESVQQLTQSRQRPQMFIPPMMPAQPPAPIQILPSPQMAYMNNPYWPPIIPGIGGLYNPAPMTLMPQTMHPMPIAQAMVGTHFPGQVPSVQTQTPVNNVYAYQTNSGTAQNQGNNRSHNQNNNKGQSQNSENNTSVPEKAATTAKMYMRKDPCPFCPTTNNQHLIIHCPSFNEWDTKPRKQKIKNVKRCIGCFNPWTKEHEYKAPSCRHCQGNHNSRLHGADPNDPPIPPPKDSNFLHWDQTAQTNENGKHQQTSRPSHRRRLTRQALGTARPS
jgi:hypothetical protein